MTTNLYKATTADVDSLTLGEARVLRAMLDHHIASNTPLSEEAVKVYGVVSNAMGGRYPAEQVAKTLGIDLATATEVDGWAMSQFYGARMGDKH